MLQMGAIDITIATQIYGQGWENKAREPLPVKQDPLAYGRNRVLRLIERSELRFQTVLGEGHLISSHGEVGRQQ